MLYNNSIAHYINVIAVLEDSGDMANYAANTMIAAGCFIWVVGFFGCCGAFIENKFMLGTVSTTCGCNSLHHCLIYTHSLYTQELKAHFGIINCYFSILSNITSLLHLVTQVKTIDFLIHW